jgi:hypothetical protein
MMIEGRAKSGSGFLLEFLHLMATEASLSHAKGDAAFLRQGVFLLVPHPYRPFPNGDSRLCSERRQCPLTEAVTNWQLLSLNQKDN